MLYNKILKKIHIVLLIIFLISLLPTAYFGYKVYFPRVFVLTPSNSQMEIDFPNWRDTNYCNLSLSFDEKINLDEKEIIYLQKNYINSLVVYNQTFNQKVDLNKSDYFSQNEIFYFRIDDCDTKKQKINIKVDENFFNEFNYDLIIKIVPDFQGCGSYEVWSSYISLMISIVSFFTWSFFFLSYAICGFFISRKKQAQQ